MWPQRGSGEFGHQSRLSSRSATFWSSGPPCSDLHPLSNGSLPEFARPPVSEVVLSVQFQPLTGLTAAHMGLFWSHIRDRFPNVQQQPPLPPVRPEDLRNLPPQVEFSVNMSAVPTLPRLLFISEEGNELLQLQGDRFIANWRRLRDEDEYPRYPHVRRYFDEAFASFRSFVKKEGLGEIVLVQYEVVYLNQILAGEGWERLGQIKDVLSFWGDQYVEPPLMEPEAASVALQYSIPNGPDPTGRLYVDVRPSLRHSDQRPLFAVNLTARMLAQSDDDMTQLPGLDIGREHIVRAFAALTSSEMHEIWGRSA